MISFFTSLKPMRGLTAVHQANALRSWRAAIPDCEIIVFDIVHGDADVLDEVKAVYRPDIQKNEFGTPLISAMFSEAERNARYPIVCYINGDILLFPDFAAAIGRLGQWKMFCAVGQRWDLDFNDRIDFSKADCEARLRAAVAATGSQHDDCAMDYFAFRRGAVGELPEFAIGRPAWDNYLIKHLIARHIPLVDLTEVAAPIHQNHDYSHIAKRVGAAWEGPEADRNRGLANQHLGRFNPRYYTIANAPWRMTRQSIVRALAPRRVMWRLLAKTIPDAARDAALTLYYVARRLKSQATFVVRNLPKLRRLVDLYAAALPYAWLPRKQRSVAVVRMDNIGDYLLWLDGARAIRKRYPKSEYRVTLVASAKWSELAEASSLFDEVVSIDRACFFSQPATRRAVCRGIARRRFETVINPTYSRDTWIDDFLVRAASGKTAIGHTGNLDNQPSSFIKRLTDSWYTKLTSDADHAAHELEKNAIFSRQFEPEVPVQVPKLDRGVIAKPAWFPAEPYFVLFPGAQREIRRWPADRFADIAARLHARTGWTGVICGLESDRPLAAQIMEKADSVRFFDACGKTSLAEFAGVIDGASFVVTNDTSTVHFAAVLSRPAVVVVGGGHYGRFLPYPDLDTPHQIRSVNNAMPCYGCGWHCTFEIAPDEPPPCITRVSVDEVWQAIETELDRKNAAVPHFIGSNE